MALPYLQMADPVREAIPKVPCWRKWTGVKKQDLIGPIEADRGDPYALQRTQEHRQRVENFVKRVNKQYRLMDEVEQVNVFQKTFLETYLDKQASRDKYSYIETDYVDNSKNISRRLTRMRARHEDMLKEMKTTTHSVNKALGFSIDV